MNKYELKVEPVDSEMKGETGDGYRGGRSSRQLEDFVESERPQLSEAGLQDKIKEVDEPAVSIGNSQIKEKNKQLTIE